MRHDIKVETVRVLRLDAVPPVRVAQRTAPRCSDDQVSDPGDVAFGKVASEPSGHVGGDRDHTALVLAVVTLHGPRWSSSWHRRANGDGRSVEIHVSASEGKRFTSVEAAAGRQMDDNGGALVDLLGGIDDLLEFIVG